MSKVKTLWACKECGHTQGRWTGSCGACQKWNTIEEELPLDLGRFATTELKDRVRSLSILEVKAEHHERFETGMTQLDRLLGGGIVEGSLTLVAGDPGIGKSTLLLQISEALAKQGKKVLYVSGEESTQQTALRARRLGVCHENVLIFSQTHFTQVKLEIEQVKPDVLIVDSIQILYKQEIQSSPGSVSQVRELAMEFMHLAKQLKIATFLIGHVTKSGEIAGPRILEHIVDVVLDFEGDRHLGHRVLRGIKNRFGPTDEIVLFQMNPQGLIEVANPSSYFLEERHKGSAGSVVIASLEGSRAILIELQALVAPAAFPTAARRSTGIDPNRLALLLAVLEKKAGYQIHHYDVFVSIAGGIKLYEPGIDLGVCMAIVSSFCNQIIDADTVIIGEVGLGGEVRGITKAENRVKEALHLGFKKCILPKKNISTISVEVKKQIEITGVESVDEAIRALIR